MRKKEWYLIEIECIKYDTRLTCKVGEKMTVAKIKSEGLANVVAANMVTVYNPEFFRITIK